MLEGMVTPNMNGEFYVSQPMGTKPTALSDFEFELTDAKFGTSDIQRSNEIETSDLKIYGTPNTVTNITGVKVTYTITQYVVVDTTPDSWYMRLRQISKEPTNTKINRISYLTRGIDPKTNTPIEGDYFCPEASISVSNDLDFGAAGDNREVEIVINETLPGEKISVLPA